MRADDGYVKASASERAALLIENAVIKGAMNRSHVNNFEGTHGDGQPS